MAQAMMYFRGGWILAAALAGGPALAQTPGAFPAARPFPARVCDVRDYGAQGTRIWYDTQAFQKAIDDCAGKGGGTVRIPRGEWLIGPLFLRSDIRLEVQKGAEVVAGSDPELYRTTPETKRFASTASFVAILNLRDVHHVAIVGEGSIDGQGEVWWEKTREHWRGDPAFATNGQARQTEGVDRPHMLQAVDVDDLLLQGVSLLNAPSYNVVLKRTHYVTIDSTRILSPAHSPNTDGIDPGDSSHIRITHNTIGVGDDHIAIKADAAAPGGGPAVFDVLIADNTLLQGRGICIGSGTSGGIQGVTVRDNTITGAMYGIRIKTRRGHGGDVTGVVFRNTRMTDVQTPLVVSSYYEYRPLDLKEAQRQAADGGFVLGNQLWPGDDDPAQPVVQGRTPYIHDVTINGLTATGADRAGVITGLPEQSITGLKLTGVRIAATTGLLVRNADVAGQGLSLTVSQGPAIIRQKGARVTLAGAGGPMRSAHHAD